MKGIGTHLNLLSRQAPEFGANRFARLWDEHPETFMADVELRNVTLDATQFVSQLGWPASIGVWIAETIRNGFDDTDDQDRDRLEREAIALLKRMNADQLAGMIAKSFVTQFMDSMAPMIRTAAGKVDCLLEAHIVPGIFPEHPKVPGQLVIRMKGWTYRVPEEALKQAEPIT